MGAPDSLALGHLGEHRPRPGKAHKLHPLQITPRKSPRLRRSAFAELWVDGNSPMRSASHSAAFSSSGRTVSSWGTGGTAMLSWRGIAFAAKRLRRFHGESLIQLPEIPAFPRGLNRLPKKVIFGEFWWRISLRA